MDIHVTIDGEVIDLHSLTDEEFAFYMNALMKYKENIPHNEFLKLLQSPEVVKGKKITREVTKSNLFRAIQDLEHRLAIRQGIVSGEVSQEEPAQKAEYVSAYKAAQMKNATITGIVRAVREGRLAGHQDKKRGHWKIPTKALEKYTPTRQNRKKK